MAAIDLQCALGFANGAVVDAATVINVAALDANMLRVVGPPTSVVSLGDKPGCLRFIVWESESTLVHSSNLRLSGNTNKTVSNGSVGVYLSDTEGHYHELVFKTAGGVSLDASWLRSTSYSSSASWSRGFNTRFIVVKAWGPGSNRGTTANSKFGDYVIAASGDDGGGASNGDVNVPFGGQAGNNSVTYQNVFIGEDPVPFARTVTFANSGGYSERTIDVASISSVPVTVVGGRVLVIEYA